MTSPLTAWNVDASTFPRGGTRAEQARFAVACAILAPSSHNTQPWKFVLVDDGLLVVADRSRSLPVIDPFDRELIISCGAALFNLRVVFARFGVPVEVTTFPQVGDPDVVARVAFVAAGAAPAAGAAAADLGKLFDAIPLRATNRRPYVEEPLPAELLDGLRTASAVEGIELRLIDALADRERLAALVADADRRQFGDAHFRRELASWIHPSRSHDGMPADSQGIRQLTDAATPVVAMAIRTFDLGGGVAASHERLARGSPLIAVLSTEVDDNEAWLLTGQALERVLLVAAKAGCSASYLNQPIEVPELRARLAAETGAAKYPQLVLRIGRGPVVPHAPRRPLEEVLS